MVSCSHQLARHWSLISWVPAFPPHVVWCFVPAQAGFGFAVVGWFWRFRPPIPFPLPFQGLPTLGQVCWCWCSLPPFFSCVPPPESRLSNWYFLNLHLISISWSSSPSSHSSGPTSRPELKNNPTFVGRVCVCGPSDARIQVTPIFKNNRRGIKTLHFTGTVFNEATNEMGYPAWPAGRTCATITVLLPMWQGATPRTPTNLALCCRN